MRPGRECTDVDQRERHHTVVVCYTITVKQNHRVLFLLGANTCKNVNVCLVRLLCRFISHFTEALYIFFLSPQFP